METADLRRRAAAGRGDAGEHTGRRCAVCDLSDWHVWRGICELRDSGIAVGWTPGRHDSQAGILEGTASRARVAAPFLAARLLLLVCAGMREYARLPALVRLVPVFVSVSRRCL